MIKAFVRQAAGEYLFRVYDLITDDFKEFDALYPALCCAKTQLGYSDSQILNGITVKKIEEKEWKPITDVFGELDLQEVVSKIPEFKEDEHISSEWEQALNESLSKSGSKPNDEKQKQIEEGEEWKKGTSSDWRDQGEGWKKEGSLMGFTTEAAPWTDEELAILKSVYTKARDKNIPHNQIYQELSNYIPHSMRGIKQKLESLYKNDDDLSSYKFEHWDRAKIIREIQRLYTEGQPISRKALPTKLEYQITNHSLPKAITRGFEVYFDSFDHAIAEAIYLIGFQRTPEGQIERSKPFESVEDAWFYYRGNEKVNNPWTKKEILRLFKLAHEAGLPLTKSFFTSRPDVYKPLIGVNKSLDGLRKSINRLGLTWGDLVIEAVPDYASWYDEEGKPQASMGELRVRRFLDLNGISYRGTTRADKIAVVEPEVLEAGYRNFIPDMFLLDASGQPIALVEVYGAIANSRAAEGELAQTYKEKIQAKEIVYKSMPMPYIAIHDNSLFGSDLSDESLKEKFKAFLPVGETEKVASIDKLGRSYRGERDV